MNDVGSAMLNAIELDGTPKPRQCGSDSEAIKVHRVPHGPEAFLQNPISPKSTYAEHACASDGFLGVQSSSYLQALA